MSAEARDGKHDHHPILLRINLDGGQGVIRKDLTITQARRLADSLHDRCDAAETRQKESNATNH
ncbi:hypothetical protein [Gulosibacter molinativorax]|uniref:Uncharacterized protein n=1 Tax=Gulosibacter molinativorax TaxID=256821 RepID=A0ABT7C656_9MICO|nr:hypothetical protein [Gulosibacter molinativorax]MDJ1370667.1 hypothetical protein [Gulosibacter molinativorax]QUY63306.1 Hypotetical protein [Gulosibacter molinativorax]